MMRYEPYQIVTHTRVTMTISPSGKLVEEERQEVYPVRYSPLRHGLFFYVYTNGKLTTIGTCEASPDVRQEIIRETLSDSVGEATQVAFVPREGSEVFDMEG